MTSNQDILAFLQADQVTRAKERENEKGVRAKERQEDMNNILDMIKMGVKEQFRRLS